MDSTIADLARRQLAAYNAADLEAFAACYHEDVVVMKDDVETLRGRDALRDQYRPMFEGMDFGGTAPQRLSAGPHCVDLEHWWRVDRATGERTEGTVLVRYRERDGLIGLVQFLS
ncbi:MAG: nuclear transport factor 2 family protein [bacterium]|nr:nuclear transport factor 2 family protein [bacterium]